MSVGEVLLSIFIVGVPALAIVPLLINLRAHRHFAYFRVVDGTTNQPLAGAELYQIKISGGGGRVVGNLVLTPDATSSLVRVGTLDPNGEFRGVFGRSSGALTLKAPGVMSGLVGLEWVSEYTRYPDAPYVCSLKNGAIQPPSIRSPIAAGLAPGEVFTRRAQKPFTAPNLIQYNARILSSG